MTETMATSTFDGIRHKITVHKIFLFESKLKVTL